MAPPPVWKKQAAIFPLFTSAANP